MSDEYDPITEYVNSADHVFMLVPAPFGDLIMGLLRVHPESACAGIEDCSIHRPSAHHMVHWPQAWHPRLGIVTRVCEHGQQHPDPDDLHARRLPAGCNCFCGCCRQTGETQ